MTSEIPCSEVMPELPAKEVGDFEGLRAPENGWGMTKTSKKMSESHENPWFP